MARFYAANRAFALVAPGFAAPKVDASVAASPEFLQGAD
jgi:hypothetical protein